VRAFGTIGGAHRAIVEDEAPEALPGLRGTLRYDEPLSRHTTWRVGGPARRFYIPADADDLARFLGLLSPEEPLLWLGLGSNLLVRDGGFHGTVINTCGLLQRVERLSASTLRFEAGVPCPKAARVSADLGLSGIEFMAGIPGTVGGALAMNAGAFGGETWEHVVMVETVDRAGVRRLRAPGDYRVGYRQVEGPGREFGECLGEWFLAGHFELSPDDAGAGKRIKALLARRNSTQPLGLASAGSTFRNPPGDHAARLIEACGLKGVREGSACVSEKHANFIINTGGATAADIERLMARVADTVESRYGMRLTPEVHIVGELASGGRD
jgi:UDP-N-acetylmuramate dehydrogenase